MDYGAYQSQQAKIEKRRALARQLQEQGLAGPQGAGMVSGRYVRSGIAAAIAPLIQAGLGTYVDSQAGKESDVLEKQQATDVDTAMSGYQKSQPADRDAALAGLSSQVSPPQDRAKMLIAQAMAPKPELVRDIDPTKYTGESLQKFSGSRNYGDLVQAPVDQSPSGGNMSPLLQAYNIAKTQGYQGDVLKFQKELSDAQANYPFTIARINGVDTLVDRSRGTPVYGPNGAPTGPLPSALPNPPPQGAAGPPGGAPAPPPIQYTAPTAGPRTQPLTTLAQEAAAGSELKRQDAAGGALGKAQGEIAGGIQTKGANADVVTGMLDEADKLIDVATGSAGGSAIDATQAMFGGSNKGAEAIARLKVLQSGLMLNAPRMEGPQSDRDVQLYREAAGQIGNPMTPPAIKRAAMDTIRTIQQKYQQRAASVNAPGAVGVPSRAPKPLTASGPNGQKLILQNGQWVPSG